MITLKESFWEPIGWTGWIKIDPTERIRMDGQWSNIKQVRWILVRKISHFEYNAIAELKIKIWVDSWRSVVGKDKTPCTRCNKLEDCIY